MGSIAGATLIAGLALFFALRRRRAAGDHLSGSSTTDPKSDSEDGAITRNRPGQRVELSSTRGLTELPSQQRNVHELAFSSDSHETDLDGQVAELDASPARLTEKNTKK